MPKMRDELLQFIKERKQPVSISEFLKQEKFSKFGQRELARALADLLKDKLIERRIVNQEIYYSLIEETKVMSAKEYQEYIDMQKRNDMLVNANTRQLIQERDEIEDNYKRSVYRHQYLLDSNHINDKDDPELKHYLEFFEADIKNLAESLELLIKNGIENFKSFNSNSSALARTNYLKELRKAFNIIYNSSIKNANYGIDISYLANEKTYALEEKFNQVYQASKRDLLKEEEFNKNYQLQLKAEQAKVYGVSVKVLDKHIVYLDAKKIMNKANSAEEFNEAKTKFLSIHDYLNSIELANYCDEQYNKIIKEEELKLVLKDYYAELGEIKEKLNNVDLELETNQKAYDQKLNEYNDAVNNVANAIKLIESNIENEIVGINNIIKDNMDKYNELFSRRVRLLEEHDKCFFLQVKRKKDIESRIDKIDQDIENTQVSSKELERKRDLILKEKTKRMNEPSLNVDRLAKELKLLQNEQIKLNKDKDLLTESFLNSQHNLNQKKAEYL